MNKVFLQFWEESERGWGVRPDGVSLHVDLESHKSYITTIYDEREKRNTVPDEYDRVIGKVLEVSISNEIFDLVILKKDIRLPQYQLNNLIKLKDIILNDE